MKHTIVINKREIEVPYKIYVAHCSQEFRTLQPMSVYNKFLNEYEISKDKVLPFMRTYLEERHHGLDKLYTHPLVTIRLAETCRNSLLFLAQLAELYVKLDYKKAEMRSISQGLLMVKTLQKWINFCDASFSEEYKCLQPLSAFYHSFVYDIDMKMSVTKKSDKFITPKLYITIDDIKKALLDIQPSITFESIRKDLDKHGIILDMDDHFIWGSKVVQNWYWKASYNDISLMNFNKLLSMHIYC